MIKHVKCKNILKIGFFNDITKSEEDLENYLNKFEIVIKGDGNFTFINELLEHIKYNS